MRIALVHYNPAAPGVAGGAESAIRDQKRALEMLGHEVVGCFDHPAALYARWSPDVIHFHTIHVDLGLGVLEWAQDRGIPHCLSLHDYWPFCADRMLMRCGAVAGSRNDASCAAVEGVCDHRCMNEPTDAGIQALVNRSHTITFNPNSAEIFRRNGIHIDTVIPHGIDTDYFTPAPDEREPGKIVMVSAWPEYNTKGLRVLKAALGKIGAGAKLVSHVPREQVRAELRKAAILVFPSTYEETWGLCLTEGMSSGLACISSNVCGPRAQICDGENGRLFPNRDVDALAGILSELLSDDGECQRLGANARAWAVEHASLGRMGQDYVRFYEELIHGT